MACVIRRKPLDRYPFWFACFTDALGRRLKRSTGHTSKSKAQRFADGLQRAADEARARTLTEERARKIISEIVASVHGGEGLHSFTVREWFDHLCKIKAKSRDKDTSAKYEQIRNEFLEFLGRKADLNILSVTSADVRRFRDLRENELSASTLNDRHTILSAFFNAAWRDHVIQSNPCTAIEAARDDLSPSQRRKQPFTLEQIIALLKAAEGNDWAGLIRLAFYTGARLENCANLRFRDLDFSSEPPVIVFEKYAKHGDEHRVPMHRALRDYLAGLAASKRRSGKVIELPEAKRDALLLPSLAGRRVTNLSKEFRKLMEKAGIENRKVREAGKGAARDVWSLGFHSFRRTNVSILANRGVSEEKRMALVAHSQRDVHKIYTHHELARLGEAVAELPSL
jgi:integrase